MPNIGNALHPKKPRPDCIKCGIAGKQRKGIVKSLDAAGQNRPSNPIVRQPHDGRQTRRSTMMSWPRRHSSRALFSFESTIIVNFRGEAARGDSAGERNPDRQAASPRARIEGGIVPFEAITTYVVRTVVMWSLWANPAYCAGGKVIRAGHETLPLRRDVLSLYSDRARSSPQSEAPRHFRSDAARA
jgi:hypothetical protein